MFQSHLPNSTFLNEQQDGDAFDVGKDNQSEGYD
jgi:hypothetical protein